MKISSQQKGSGKLGNSVYAQYAGVCVAREKAAKVYNPNTTAQVAQRARFKLASQLSAALESSIVIPKKGMVSSRNQFVQMNIEQINVSGGVAQVSYENLKLTAGNSGLPSVSVQRANSNLNIALTEAAGSSISRVVYEVYKKSAENQLMKVASLVVSEAGENNTFPAITADFAGDVVIYAYGMIDKDAAATAKFNNYSVQSGSDIARLVSTRSITTDSYKFTQTRGLTMFANESSAEGATPGQLYVYISAGGGGSVSGTGFSNGRKAVQTGDSVTVTATPSEGNTFTNWQRSQNGALTTVSTNATYTFTVGEDNVDLIANFYVPGQAGGGSEEEGGM